MSGERSLRALVLAACLAGGAARAAGAQRLAASPSDSLATRAAEVRHLVAQRRWSAALAALGPLGRDSVGRALAARLAVNAGLDALRSGDSAQAQAFWERAVREDPSVPEGPVDLASFLLARGRRDAARAVASAGLRATPGDARLLETQAATITDTADYRAVLERAREAHGRAPADEGVALDYAGLLAGSRRLAAAAVYDTILRKGGASATAFLSAAAFWKAGGRLDVAVAMTDSGLAHHPRDGRLWMARGRLSADGGRWPEAVSAYRRAAGLPASASAARLPLADAELAAGDTAAADSLYRTMLALEPDGVTALDDAAELAAARGDTARAVALYRRELAVDSGKPWAPLGLLRLERPAPDGTRARELLLAAEWRGLAALQRTEMSSLSQRSDAGGGGERARLVALVRAVLDTVVFETSWGPAELEQLQRAYPGSPLLGRYAAALEARHGDDSAALARYADLVREAPADTLIQRERAALLERLGRGADAALGWARVLDLDPDDTTAFRALVRYHERSGTLETLLAQIRRLRVGLPASRLLGEHEIEVLQRLGRLEEAAAVAKRLEAKPT